jgi:hypothetical protein
LLFGLIACFLAWGAQEATECGLDESACKFTITLNIAFDSGADDSYIWNAKTEIEDFWNNEGGDPPTVGECDWDYSKRWEEWFPGENALPEPGMADASP